MIKDKPQIEKRKCGIQVSSKLVWNLEKKLTKEEWENLKRYIKEDEIDGIVLIENFGKDRNNPDNWEDEVEDHWSDWDE